MKITTRLSPLAVLLLAFSLSAQEPAVPDFSKGMPDVKLEKKLKIQGQEAFILKTSLGSGDFAKTLGKFLGDGWRRLAPDNHEGNGMADGANIAGLGFSVYRNADFPGVDLQVIHADYKKADADSRVTILVIRHGPLVRDFGSFSSPDGTRRLEVKRRGKDLVDFEVFDSASGKKLASDSIGWSAMRWFLHWEDSSRLWGYGSDVQYFKLFEFKPDGSVAETEVDVQMPVPTAIWDNLPSSLQKKYTAEQDGADQPATAPETKPEGDPNPKTESEGRPR
ncbi:MAG: hypothetical protein HKN82_11815 [Akkermansiaceae bacterium]|nr:hypothetical protein [Akkermansiaceae bacterium]